MYSCYIYWDSVAAIYVGPTDCSDGGALRQLVLSSSTKICFAIFHSIFYIRVHCLYYSIYIHTLSVSFYIHCLYYSIYTLSVLWRSAKIVNNTVFHSLVKHPTPPIRVCSCVGVCVCVCECYDPVVDFYG